MAGKRQPTDVVIANGRKHLSKTEEAERRAGEVKVDADTLGRYLVAQHQWLIATAEVEKALSQKDPETGQIRKKRDLAAADSWGKIQERYFKQARNCANDMGLTVTSRCRLVVPESNRQATEDNNPFLEVIRGGKASYG